MLISVFTGMALLVLVLPKLRDKKIIGNAFFVNAAALGGLSLSSTLLYLVFVAIDKVFKGFNLPNWLDNLDNVMYYFGNCLFYGSIFYLAFSIYGYFVKSASISISDVEESDSLIDESRVKEVIAFVLIGIFGLLIVSHFG